MGGSGNLLSTLIRARRQNKTKNKIIKFCMEQLRQAERNAEAQSIKLIEKYKNVEKHAYRTIE